MTLDTYDYDDDYRDDVSDLPTFRSYCETGECGWSSPGSDSHDVAEGALEDHLAAAHPGERQAGSVDQT